jgi:hypothetical protein
MIDASVLVSNLVALLRDIPELVAALGSADRIQEYRDRFPDAVSLPYAIHQMPTSSILVAWQGTQPGTLDGVDVWRHQIGIYVRSGEVAAPTAYPALFRLITKGVPTSVGIQLSNATVHPSCYPMDLPTIQRAADAEGLDYFEVTTTFTEMGDD